MKNIERITVHEVNFDILDTLLTINFKNKNAFSK